MKKLSLMEMENFSGGKKQIPTPFYFLSGALCAGAVLGGPIGAIMFGPSCAGSLAGLIYDSL